MIKSTSLLSLLSIYLLFAGKLTAQQKCCAVNATYAFADLANDPSFLMEHDIPLPYKHESEIGSMITYPAGEGKDANGFLLKINSETNNWLIVVHEWWGLNDYIKKESEKFYHALGVNILAIDLYDGKVATTRESARSNMQAVTKERAEEIINGAIAYMGENAKIATIGWCFGGSWSLQSSILAAEKGVGCVMYYGMPETDLEKIKVLNGPVLGLFANNDGSITPTIVEDFIANMNKAGKHLSVKQYDNVGHAFANPSSERYHEPTAQDAYKITIEFLASTFR